MIHVPDNLIRGGVDAGDVRTELTANDVIDGVRPQLAVTPRTAAAAAAALKWASDTSQSTVIRGAGTKLDWGRPPQPIGLALDMRHMSRLVSHAHGDLVATIEAGARLADVNRALAAHNQYLPIDPAFADAATIGGILATNDSGPIRHRYGTPRDLVLGVELATADGLVVKSGGQVVKNVAGYDLARLMAGSHGAFAAITSATFKLAPAPAASATVTAAGRLDLLDVLPALVQHQLEPTACEVVATLDAVGGRARAWQIELLIRFATHPAAVASQVSAASALAAPHADAVDVLRDTDEPARWNDHAAVPWSTHATIVRLSWLPADLRGGLMEIGEAISGASGDVRACVIGRAGVGAGTMTVSGPLDLQAAVVTMLRASTHFGHVVVLRAPAPLRAQIDPWGPMGDRTALVASVKRAFDPKQILNAGRGPC